MTLNIVSAAEVIEETAEPLALAVEENDRLLEEVKLRIERVLLSVGGEHPAAGCDADVPQGAKGARDLDRVRRGGQRAALLEEHPGAARCSRIAADRGARPLLREELKGPIGIKLIE